ncbi:MAG TPA: hypothetical protein PLB05_01105 [Candidatus Omnitrophota bacterium]|nr:hypothetical protein [Candidatus Omnitrophota bacterium]
MDAITFRGIERLLIIIGAVVYGYLGYRLYIKGITTGEDNLKFGSKVVKIILSGTSPGLFFMAFGAIVLITSVVTGGASIKEDLKEQTIRMRTGPSPLGELNIKIEDPQDIINAPGNETLHKKVLQDNLIYDKNESLKK